MQEDKGCLSGQAKSRVEDETSELNRVIDSLTVTIVISFCSLDDVCCCSETVSFLTIFNECTAAVAAAGGVEGVLEK